MAKHWGVLADTKGLAGQVKRLKGNSPPTFCTLKTPAYLSRMCLCRYIAVKHGANLMAAIVVGIKRQVYGSEHTELRLAQEL